MSPRDDLLDAYESWPEPPEDWGWWDSIEEQDRREEAEFGGTS